MVPVLFLTGKRPYTTFRSILNIFYPLSFTFHTFTFLHKRPGLSISLMQTHWDPNVCTASCDLTCKE